MSVSASKPKLTPSSSARVRVVGGKELQRDGDFVVYWMTSARRLTWNFGLDRAVSWATSLQKPLCILEALRADYPHASVRFHGFVAQGMLEKRQALGDSPVLYWPYLEPAPHAGRGLLAQLSQDACVIVTDDFPTFFLPAQLERAAQVVSCLMEVVDSNGVLPMRQTDKVYTACRFFRGYVHREFLRSWPESPQPRPLAKIDLPELPLKKIASIMRTFPSALTPDITEASLPKLLQSLPIDQTVGLTQHHGGETAARNVLREFVNHRLSAYAEDRNEPDKDGASGLSPYLHFGFIAADEIFHALLRKEAWSPSRIDPGAAGSREGFWGVSPPTEAFLDQLLCWRELGYNYCANRSDAADFSGLPNWAQKTLLDHAEDDHPELYSLKELEHAKTQDKLWNAAQNQLATTGTMHNYLRMLWGKKILEWSPNPKTAMKWMVYLNDKFALDGRNPNSYCGIGWVLGRYDRPWGPTRPIFGSIRYMSSANTARKFSVKKYLAEFAPPTKGA